jgi:hypothetical protein
MALHRAVLNAAGDRIDPQRWIAAFESHQPVGNCDDCHGALMVLPAYDGSPISAEHNADYYEAQCLSCEKVLSAPGGRILRSRRFPLAS